MSLFYSIFPDFYQQLLTLLVCNVQDPKLARVLRTNSVFFLTGFLSVGPVGDAKILDKGLELLLKLVEEYSVKTGL